MSLAVTLREAHAIERVLVPLCYGVTAAEIASRAGLPRWRVHALLRALVAAGLVGWAPDLLDGDRGAGRPGRRYFWNAPAPVRAP